MPLVGPLIRLSGVPRGRSCSIAPPSCAHLWVSLFLLRSFFFFVFLGPHLQRMDIPGLGVESELQLRAYPTATATATQDPNRICDLHGSLQQPQTHNPRSEATDRTCILTETVGRLPAEPQRALQQRSYLCGGNHGIFP